MTKAFSAQLDDALAALRNHAEGQGIKPDTAMQYATGDARRLTSIQRKAAEIDATLAQVNQWLASGASSRRRNSSR